MPIFRREHIDPGRRIGWQEYQARLNRSRRHKPGLRWIIGLTAVLSVFLMLYLGWLSKSAANAPLPRAAELPPSDHDTRLTKKDVQLLLSHAHINHLDTNRLELQVRNQRFELATSLDATLQSYLMDAMDRKNSRYIAIVVLDPDSGRILSLAGFDKTSPDNNPCVQNAFPAASLFKIVTAAAAVDVCGLTPGTPLYYNGGRYTLYKSQLRDTHNTYTRTLSFRDSFAQSVNPVFGKLGMEKLKKPVLEKYGSEFGFNDEMQFELPVPPSRLRIKNTPYNWAEIACGFNNETTLSPLHAAMIVSAVINQGEMILPSIVDDITDEKGHILYQAHPRQYGRVMSNDAAQVLIKLMEATVRSGTAHKAFRNHLHDHALAGLKLGGKTGSIFNLAHDVRYDWFVGFAQSKDQAHRLVVAALVGHGEYIGIRAAVYARKVFSYYFGNALTQQSADSKKGADADS